MKKVIVILSIIIVLLVGFIGFFGFKMNQSNIKLNDVLNGKIEEVVVTNEEEPKKYGNRGNISQTEKIKFLAKNDEYLVGMIGLDKSTEEKEFTNEDMIRFALNIAVYRYSSILETKKTKTSSGYLVQTKMLNEITNEFFGNSNVPFDQKTNPYYSVANKGFIFTESIEKSLYYYPVSQDELIIPLEVATTVEPTISEAPVESPAAQTEGETPETTEATPSEEPKVEIPTKKYIIITADAIFVPDQDTEEFEKAKYEGLYEEKDVDSTIKFKFDSNGKLVSYQNL